MAWCTFWVSLKDIPIKQDWMRFMTQFKRLSVFGFATIAAVFTVALHAQVGDPGTLIQEKLVSEVKLTKAAADHSDMVTAGDIVVLHKDGLMMCSSVSPYAFSNMYSNGVLAPTVRNRAASAAKGWLKGTLSGGSSLGDAVTGSGCASRKFVAGEKFWVTGFTLQKDGILAAVFSDAYNDVRYYGEIKFLFPKGQPVPPVDSFVKTVNEVMTVQPADDKGDSQTASKDAAPAAAPTPAAPMAAIAPPPPPADAPPPSIEVGQTKDQVTAGFGQPTRTAKLAGTKEIYFYKDMKVTFLNGKVSKIE